MSIGIYKITSPSGRVYIGQSIEIEQRWKHHRYCKSTQKRLNRSFNKYGIDNHFFEIIEYCEYKELNKRERYWQDFYDVLGENGLNCRLQHCGDMSGVLSDEHKRKISESNKGKKMSETQRLQMSISRRGRKLSEDHKKSIGDSIRGDKNGMYGRIRPESERLNISNARKGIIFTKEHIKNMTESRKGYRHSEKTKIKIGQSNKGKVISEESKLKMRIAKLGTKQSKEQVDMVTKRMTDSNPRAILVINTETGIYYECIRDAAISINANKDTLRVKLRGKIKNNTPFIYA